MLCHLVYLCNPILLDNDLFIAYLFHTSPVFLGDKDPCAPPPPLFLLFAAPLTNPDTLWTLNKSLLNIQMNERMHAMMLRITQAKPVNGKLVSVGCLLFLYSHVYIKLHILIKWGCKSTRLQRYIYFENKEKNILAQKSFLWYV